jgi:hypothetical protein
MARIVVQTDDRHTVLDEGDVHVADIRHEASSRSLLGRLEQALRDAERRRFTRACGVRRLAVIVPSSYRDVGG